MSEKVSIDDVSKFLLKTGFILEMEVNEKLLKAGYKTKVGEYFVDYDENKKREIDIIARQTINDINVTLVIECKQSLMSDWIFVCSNKNPARYYKYIKYFPQNGIDVSESKIFDHLHTVDQSIPMAQNFIIRDKKGKQVSPEPITTAAIKVPKAVIYEAKKIYSDEKRNILIPVSVFSGQLFKADYDGELKIEEVNHVQYPIDLDTRPYKYIYPHGVGLYLGRQEDALETEGKNSPVSEISRELGKSYLVNFISKIGVDEYLSRVNIDISSIDIKKWPVKESKKEEVD